MFRLPGSRAGTSRRRSALRPGTTRAVHRGVGRAPDEMHFQRVSVRWTAALILAARDHASEALAEVHDALGLLGTPTSRLSGPPHLQVRLAQRLGRWEEVGSTLDELMESIEARQLAMHRIPCRTVLALIERAGGRHEVGRLERGGVTGTPGRAGSSFVGRHPRLDRGAALQAELRLARRGARGRRPARRGGRVARAARAFWRRGARPLPSRG